MYAQTLEKFNVPWFILTDAFWGHRHAVHNIKYEVKKMIAEYVKAYSSDSQWGSDSNYFLYMAKRILLDFTPNLAGTPFL